MIKGKFISPIVLTLTIAAFVPALQGCFPAVATGTVIGALIITDRRTIGTQAQDTEIQITASNRIREKFPGSEVHTNCTVYNHKLLITGEAPSEEIKREIQLLVQDIPNLQGIYNELAVGPVSSLSSRSNDTYITSKIKARQIDVNFSANHVKVVTEARHVYLFGLVTQREAQAAIQVARTTSDVVKVISLFEILPYEKAQAIDNPPATEDSQPPPEQTIAN